MLRLTINFVAGISLLVALLLASSWASQVLPYRYQIRFYFTPVDSPTTVVRLGCSSNMLMIGEGRRVPHPLIGPLASNAAQVDSFFFSYQVPTYHPTWIGVGAYDGPLFEKIDGHITLSGTRKDYLVPCGILIPLFAILPAWRWLPAVVGRLRCRFIIPVGHCRKCGYDLRASPDVCPECGTPCNSQPLTT